MRLHDWYIKMKDELEQNGFELDFDGSEEKQSLDAFRPDVSFTFTEWGNKYADYTVMLDDHRNADIGRQDNVKDINAYFAEIYSSKVLPIIKK